MNGDATLVVARRMDSVACPAGVGQKDSGARLDVARQQDSVAISASHTYTTQHHCPLWPFSHVVQNGVAPIVLALSIFDPFPPNKDLFHTILDNYFRLTTTVSKKVTVELL